MLLVGIATALTIISTAPAGAGGSWLDPSWVRVEAGEPVELSGFVSHGQLGWIDDGPFYTYLRGDSYGQVLTEAAGGAETDVPLGELTVVPRSNGVQVSTDFVLPTDIPPGEYWVLVCNHPCTTGLGDLIGGVIYVGIDPPSLEEEITSIDTDRTPTTTATIVVTRNDTAAASAQRGSGYLALSPYPDRTSGLSPLSVVISMALAAVVLVGAVATRYRSDG